MANEIEVTALASKDATALATGSQIITYEQTGDTTRTPFFAAVAEANTQNGGALIKEASLTIASADVLTLNSTPIEIVSAPGAGYAIEVISASIKMVYVSATYTTNTNLILITSTGSDKQASTDIGQASTTFSRFELEMGSADATQYVDNQAVVVSVDGGDPTAGDSDIKIYVTYRLIQI